MFSILLIVGGILGTLIALRIDKHFFPGIIGNMLAGIMGAWIGQKLFGIWGPIWFGVFFFPSILGILLFVSVFSWVLIAAHREKRA
ncbi:GlsB/YeaQ/YmgE family stress response membrane protein [Bacillus thuringiensis]|uniref:GlsB/YeaQ/YmgE family stress response membrane protein n=1 Tax=Bacillus thuringiensis TaxID=1428 RepID=UPI001FAC20BE